LREFRITKILHKQCRRLLRPAQRRNSFQHFAAHIAIVEVEVRGNIDSEVAHPGNGINASNTTALRAIL